MGFGDSLGSWAAQPGGVMKLTWLYVRSRLATGSEMLRRLPAEGSHVHFPPESIVPRLAPYPTFAVSEVFASPCRVLAKLDRSKLDRSVRSLRWRRDGPWFAARGLVGSRSGTAKVRSWRSCYGVELLTIRFSRVASQA